VVATHSAGRSSLVVALGLVAGCALRGDVRKVELQVASLRADVAHSDSTRAAERDSILAVIRVVQQTLAAQQAYLVQLRGDLRTDLLAVQQQLVAVQELTGQSQQRLTELRSRIESRAQQPEPILPSVAGGAPVGPSGNAAGPGPDQMYDLSLQQYRRGSLSTARLGFREFLRVFPTNERAADALFYIGESFERESPDSAVAVYQQVVKTYPNSPRAPSALYKQGLLAEQRGDRAGARTLYQRVIAGYPRSPEADLARQNQQRLRP
jgi:tol-pal system protein YbgF